jgi:hypothetical protein
VVEVGPHDELMAQSKAPTGACTRRRPAVSALPEKFRSLLEAELAVREFTPQISALVSVSSFSTPSTWTVNTDRGHTTFVLKSEDDIRRLSDGRLLIHSAQGLNFAIADRARLDKASRLLLERFL